ncbi:hypothetical protein T439DRAFT_353052 [Meredithblackwellia eburnea MCA 4105]
MESSLVSLKDQNDLQALIHSDALEGINPDLLTAVENSRMLRSPPISEEEKMKTVSNIKKSMLEAFQSLNGEWAGQGAVFVLKMVLRGDKPNNRNRDFPLNIPYETLRGASLPYNEVVWNRKCLEKLRMKRGLTNLPHHHSKLQFALRVNHLSPAVPGEGPAPSNSPGTRPTSSPDSPFSEEDLLKRLIFDDVLHELNYNIKKEVEGDDEDEAAIEHRVSKLKKILIVIYGGFLERRQMHKFNSSAVLSALKRIRIKLSQNIAQDGWSDFKDAVREVANKYLCHEFGQWFADNMPEGPSEPLMIWPTNDLLGTWRERVWDCYSEDAIEKLFLKKMKERFPAAHKYRDFSLMSKWKEFAQMHAAKKALQVLLPLFKKVPSSGYFQPGQHHDTAGVQGIPKVKTSPTSHLRFLPVGINREQIVQRTVAKYGLGSDLDHNAWINTHHHPSRHTSDGPSGSHDEQQNQGPGSSSYSLAKWTPSTSHKHRSFKIKAHVSPF